MPPARVVRALLSVSDKSGLDEFGRGLAELGVELVASGGTARALRDAGLEVQEVESLTGSPEMLGGRVKTLHPKVHGGILNRRDHEGDRAEVEKHGIGHIDLVVVNLYPFEETVAREGVTRAEAVEQIDIGGPSMIRSAAKNHAFVGVVVDPADYPALLEELRSNDGVLDEATRRALALKAFERTAAYDAAISGFLAAQETSEDDPFPPRLAIGLGRAQSLRYGENPHQRAALYGGFLEIAEKLHGKELSFNNIVDVQAALALILEFDAAESAAVAILKHNTPCGAGVGDSPLAAYDKAFGTDPDSPFGGIIVCNRPFDLELAQRVDEIFTEVLIAPDFTAEALALLQKKKNRRLLRARLDRIQRGLCFAWKVVKHVKSNAVVFAGEDRTLAIGGGNTSRVDAVHAACEKAGRVGNALAGSVLASDAFFPFPDGLETAVAAGATAVVQPGGSARDEQVIEAADRLGVAMVLTGARHFRH
jgi:phosphoribosylaminoimidazolecarboxamide formyltransferase/IMP cyclohydrolase